MLCTTVTSFHVVDLRTLQNGFNSQCFMEHTMLPLVQEIVPHDRNRWWNNFSWQNDALSIPHPPYNLDLVPPDLWLFENIRISLARSKFDEPEQLLDGIIKSVDTISVKELRPVLTTGCGR
jgi:hypothetical protein